MHLSKSCSKKMGYSDEIWMTFVTLKNLGPSKDIFVHLAFDHDETTLKLKINKIPMVESCTSMLLRCGKQIGQFRPIITKFWAPKSKTLMIDHWATPKKACMPKIMSIIWGKLSQALTLGGRYVIC